MEAEGSLPFSQGLATWPNPDPDEFNLRRPSLWLEGQF
jgi:hypothetical protein